MTNISLSVNLNKIALIRNSRDGNFPDVVEFAKLSIDAGAKGITVHPRPDLRHITPTDVLQLAELTKKAQVEFNIEGNPFAPPNENYPGFTALVAQAKPTQCTLVPDSETQKTSDHGFDLTRDYDKLAPLVTELKSLDTRISLFMDPDPAQISLAQQIGADRIELYTGPFAWAYENDEIQGKEVFAQHCTAAQHALTLGLGVNAGHDLNLNNMKLYKTLPGLQEVSIGHALTVDALLMGFSKSVQAYIDICS